MIDIASAYHALDGNLLKVNDLREHLNSLQAINFSTMTSGQPTNGMCVQRWIDEAREILDD